MVNGWPGCEAPGSGCGSVHPNSDASCSPSCACAAKHWPTSPQGTGLGVTKSPTLRIPTIQTRRTPIHDHLGLGVALVAHGGAGREARAVAGDGDVLFVVGGAVGDGRGRRSDPSPALPFAARKGGGSRGAAGDCCYFTVFLSGLRTACAFRPAWRGCGRSFPGRAAGRWTSCVPRRWRPAQPPVRACTRRRP